MDVNILIQSAKVYGNSSLTIPSHSTFASSNSQRLRKLLSYVENNNFKLLNIGLRVSNITRSITIYLDSGDQMASWWPCS